MTESLTLLSQTHAPQSDYDALTPHFTDKEIAELTMTIGLINAWNRIGAGLRLPVEKASF